MPTLLIFTATKIIVTLLFMNGNGLLQKVVTDNFFDHHIPGRHISALERALTGLGHNAFGLNQAIMLEMGLFRANADPPKPVKCVNNGKGLQCLIV